MALPLLDIVTRHLPARAAELRRQQASLTFPLGDWVQTLLVDPYGAGVPRSHVWLRTYEPRGRFVWVLDDDDVCLVPNLLDLIDQTATVTIGRMQYWRGIAPDPETWRRMVEAAPAPAHAAMRRFPEHISPQCLIMTREHWLAHRGMWAERYDGDRPFVQRAYMAAARVTCRQDIVVQLRPTKSMVWPTLAS